MLIVFLSLTQLALFTAGILGPWRDAPELKNNGRLPRPVRMLLSLSLVAAALLIALDPFRADAVYTRWVFLGMLASFVGDLIMARLIPLPNRLIGGMLAFAVAHALYITAYTRTILTNGAPLLNAGLFFGLAFYGIFTVFGWRILIRNPEKPRTINLGALAYGIVVGAMATFALALAFAVGGAFWLAAVGGALFVSSDFLIGVTDIRGIQIKNANDWIWLTYVAAQMGIIYAGWLV